MYGGVYRVGKVGGRRGEGWLRGGVGVGGGGAHARHHSATART